MRREKNQRRVVKQNPRCEKPKNYTNPEYQQSCFYYNDKGLGHLFTIKIAVNIRWDRLDLSAKVLFNTIEIETVFVGYEVDC